MRIVASEFMSLDGVVQAPGDPAEDTSGGFRHGGWSLPYFDPVVMGATMNEIIARSEALLQGAHTYRVSAAAWPQRPGPFADWVNAAQKYVVSGTLGEADVAAWKPTTLIRPAELVPAVTALRERAGGDVYVYGSLTLVRALLAARLIDELVLMIEPVTLGGGKRLFAEDGQSQAYRLVSAVTANTGVQVCRYRPVRS